MIGTALALLAASTSGGDIVMEPRKAYNSCLRKLVTPALDSSVKPDEFVTQMKEKCATQQAAFRLAIVTQNRADGMGATNSNTDADEQVQDVLDRFKENYVNYQETNTHPD